MSKRYERSLSPNELLIVKLQETLGSSTIQYVIEGSGFIPKDKFEKAVNKAAEYCPVAKSNFEDNKWIDNNLNIPIFYLSEEVEDVFSLEILNKKINIYKNPPTEIYFLGKNKILFRIFHGAMDGKGALLWIENIFRALRKETLLEGKSLENDLTLLKKLDYKTIKNPFTINVKSVNNLHFKNENYFERLSINGNYRAIVPKISKAITDFFPENSKFLIPVDLRRHNIKFFSTSNLLLPIFLETNKNESWEDINGNYLFKLKNNEELNMNSADLGILPYLPVFLFKMVISILLFLEKSLKKHLFSSIISFLGKINTSNLSCDEFNCNIFYSLPIQEPLIPIAVVISENSFENSSEEILELIFTFDGRVFDKALSKKLLLHLEKTLKGN